MPSSTIRRPRHALILGLGVTLALGMTTTACSSSDDGASPSVPVATASASIAENVDIGDGRTIYVECHGEATDGAPTVLLLSGGGTASDLWHAADQDPPNVYDTIGAQTRVCAFDRPGVQKLDGEPSRSTPVAQPITPKDGADDLQALLRVLDMEGPYVLAAHSFAGNIARVFAAENPGEVEGIVFVDVLSPELRAQMTPDQWRAWIAANVRSPEQIAAYPDLEQYDFDESLDTVETAEAETSPRPMPVVVLTASQKFADLVPQYIDEGLLPADTPRDLGVLLDRTNPEAQRQIADHYPGSAIITDTNSGHNIMVENGPIVIQAIEDVLAAVKAGRTALTGT